MGTKVSGMRLERGAELRRAMTYLGSKESHVKELKAGA